MSIPTAVFLDTSILDGQQYNFESTALSTFVPVCKERGLTLLPPEPTENEIERHIRQRSSDALAALADARRTREVNRLRMAASASVTASERELRRVETEIGRLVQALKDGVPASVVKDPLIALEAQQTELRSRLARATQPPPLLHPNMADLYREKVTQLARGLEHEESRTGAAEALRGLIDAIVLTPHGGELQTDVRD